MLWRSLYGRLLVLICGVALRIDGILVLYQLVACVVCPCLCLLVWVLFSRLVDCADVIGVLYVAISIEFDCLFCE